MPKYAKGIYALGECARSGRVMKLRDMVPDGQYPGLMVDPAWRDIKHPAELPFRTEEGIALKRPAPDVDDDSPGDSGESLEDAFGFTNSFGGGT